MNDSVVRPTRTDLQLPSGSGRFLVVSDRLPILLTREAGAGDAASCWKAAPASGALISALSPVLQERGGVWLGWPGVSEEEIPGLRQVLAGGIQGGGYSLRPVSLKEQEHQGCYRGFAREVIWPLFHGLPLDCNFDPAYWQAYRKVNRRFAGAVAKAVAGTGGGADFVWVHNYLLMHVAAELRKLRVRSRTAFFLHVPFPSPDLFLKLPWRKRLLSGLLAYDQVGFQTRRDLRNFLECVQELIPGAVTHQSGRGLWTVQAETSGRPSGEKIELRAGAFPVGVDYHGFAERAAEPEVEARVAALRQAFQKRRLILGVDHMDRTLGIPEKLQAFALALERHPELREKVTLVQVVVPSRENVPGHAALRAEVERLVGEINGRFSRPGWVPLHYYHRMMPPADLIAHYRAADVALITPIKEGMNLVAKEFCAANLEERGVLVLSEFAGAAAQLTPGALTVNPHNTAATARTLVRALEMRPEERTARMRSLRQEVRRHDVHRWVDSFLAAALTLEPGHFLDQEAAAGLQSYN